MLPSETMIWQPEFTDKTLSRKPGAVQYFLRQQRRGELEFVLHLHLRDIRIGPGLEGKGNCHATGGIAGGGHIHQVIDTVHILFDNLRHRILHGLRISARIVC
ncbi:hypothetical protein ESCOCK434M_25785 [Escherichia coli]